MLSLPRQIRVQNLARCFELNGYVYPSFRKLFQPDWQDLHDELANNKNMSLMLLWQELKKAPLPATNRANSVGFTVSGARRSIYSPIELSLDAFI